MATITAFEAKTRFGELLERVGRGEEIVITRHDRPVARIVPEGRASHQQVERAVQTLHELRATIARQPRRSRLSAADVRSAISAGRR
jgi:prevent-host-death family protein